jgi:uncharacterized protein (TIGR02300 family)
MPSRIALGNGRIGRRRRSGPAAPVAIGPRTGLYRGAEGVSFRKLRQRHFHLTRAHDQTNRSARQLSSAGGRFPRCFLFEDQLTVAKPELGSKRQCQSCGVKFFDLNKDPILCPKCGAVFHAAPPARAASRAAEADEEAETEKEGVETISLDEVAADESKIETVDADEDVEIDDTAADDDTFLEQEEEDQDDVAGLIDSDIETDEDI